MTPFVLHHLLDRAADRSPDHEAIRCGSDRLTYGQLQQRSNATAAALIGGGIGRGDRVGLYLPKSVEGVTAIYGAMKAGAAYVPIDPTSPVIRAASIARDCTVAAIVTTADRAEGLLAELGSHRPRMILLAGDEGSVPDLGVHSVSFASIAEAGPVAPSVPVIDTDIAYILYTSGSTGAPKGVMLTHRHALTFIEWCASTIGSHPDDRFSNHAPFHFDLSVFDLYLAAYGAATVSVVPDEWAYFGRDLVRFIQGEGITVWYSVPSALMMITRAAHDGASFSTLRSVVFAGEVYPTKSLRALRTLVPTAALWNLYGPTETNVCTYHRVVDLPEDDGPIPIGRACENTEVFALREDGQPVDVEEEGELYVRGSAVMKGYWGRPERSADVLIDDPRRGVSGMAYRTGDLVRLRSDGEYEFLGRKDQQIKSRGYRIELGEVEAALNADPRLESAVAVAVPHEGWGKAIVAYVVPRDGNGAVGEIDVKRAVASRLPRHMVPARVQVTSHLPRTSTGKLDRRRIAERASSKDWSWE